MRKILRYIKNCYRFRKELANFNDWDYRYNLDLFKKSLEMTLHYIDCHGHHVDESRLPVVAQMERAIELINNVVEDNFTELAEQSLGKKIIFHEWDLEDFNKHLESYTAEEKEHNQIIYKESGRIEKMQWNELIELLKGDDDIKGSGILNWWD